jgi:hypothetical protein
MGISLEDVLALEQLDQRVKAILPERYGETFKDVLPVSMGSAPLKYDAAGRVAWNEIWGSFCDLAMAGGPPHRGTLLEPGLTEDIEGAPEKYLGVVQELCRGLSLVTGLPAKAADQPGLVELQCSSFGMAAWLMRAAVMENVLALQAGTALLLPAGPDFRLNKEIKNVITTIAKTCHYWLDHTSASRQAWLEEEFANASPERILLRPALRADIAASPGGYRRVLDAISDEIENTLRLPCFRSRYGGWVGVECATAGRAVWMMRAMVTENILVRRENEVLFLPVHPEFESLGQTARVPQTFRRLHALCIAARI